MNYIQNLEEAIDKIKLPYYETDSSWFNRKRKESLEKQIELYKINKWRLCE